MLARGQRSVWRQSVQLGEPRIAPTLALGVMGKGRWDHWSSVWLHLTIKREGQSLLLQSPISVCAIFQFLLLAVTILVFSAWRWVFLPSFQKTPGWYCWLLNFTLLWEPGPLLVLIALWRREIASPWNSLLDINNKHMNQIIQNGDKFRVLY